MRFDVVHLVLESLKGMRQIAILYPDNALKLAPANNRALLSIAKKNMSRMVQATCWFVREVFKTSVFDIQISQQSNG